MENANHRHRQPPPNRDIWNIYLSFSVFCAALTFTLFYDSARDQMINELSKLGRVEQVAEQDVYRSREAFEMNYSDMEENFKIYVYPMYHEEDDDDDQAMEFSNKGKHGCAWQFFKNLKESSFTTDDPVEAHLFFVPLSNHKMLQQVASEAELGFLVEKYMHHLISKYPYWNRTSGSDHLFISCEDFDIQATKHILFLIKNSTRLVYSPSHESDHNYVSIPSVMKPFKGHMEMYIVNRGKKRLLRKVSIDAWSYSQGVDIRNNGSYFNHAQRDDKFCDCSGSGSIHTSDCIVTAIHYDCVPVISADYDPPFSDVLDWRTFSVIVRGSNDHYLRTLLSVKSDKQYEALYQNLLKVRHHFQWNSPSMSYDAFRMVLNDLWLRRKLLDTKASAENVSNTFLITE